MYFTDCRVCNWNYISHENRKHVPYYSSFGGSESQRERGEREGRNCSLCIFFHQQCNFWQQKLDLAHSCMGTSWVTPMLLVSYHIGPHLDDSVGGGVKWDAGQVSERVMLVLQIKQLFILCSTIYCILRYTSNPITPAHKKKGSEKTGSPFLNRGKDSWQMEGIFTIKPR